MTDPIKTYHKIDSSITGELELWAVNIIDDDVGRKTRDIALFTTEYEANRFADSDQGRDMYGGRGDVILRNITIYCTAEEAGAKTWEYSHKDATKKAIIAKLSSDECELLGIRV